MRIDDPTPNRPLEQDWPEAYSTVEDYELDQDGIPVYVKTVPASEAPADGLAHEVRVAPERFYPDRSGPAPRDDGARLRSEPKLSRAQQRLEDILTNSENELREARDLIVSALEDFSLVAVPQHPNLPTLIGQQLEQVIEHRTLRRR